MKEKYFKRSIHTPAHLFINDYYYFITAGCYHKKAYSDCDGKKEFLYKTICEELKRYFCELHGWAVLDNHYHLLTKLQDAFSLPKLIQSIHSKSAISRIEWTDSLEEKSGMIIGMNASVIKKISILS
jgi:putative transposase